MALQIIRIKLKKNLKKEVIKAEELKIFFAFRKKHYTKIRPCRNGFEHGTEESSAYASVSGFIKENNDAKYNIF